MAKSRKSVTMAAIAKEMGVSVVTVSKALSDQKGVSQKLKADILEKAKELGYELPGLREKKTYTIGVILAQRYLDDFGSFYWRMYQEVVAWAGKRHLFVIYENITEEMAKKNLMPHMVTEKKIDGLLLIGNPGFEYSDFLEKNAGLPLVFLDFYNKRETVDCVISDGFYGSYLLTNYLLEKGHRKIGYVGTLYATDSITDRFLGYTKALLERGITPREDYIIPDRDVETGLRENYPEYRFPGDMPTALVCNCDFIANLVIRDLLRKGYQVPGEVSVVGFDNDPNPAFAELPLTTYEVDMGAMAGKAVNYLVKRMEGEVTNPGIHIVKGKLVEKDSVRALERK